MVGDTLARITEAVAGLSAPEPAPNPLELEHQEEFLLRTREKCLASPLSWEDRGVVLELGSAKRAFYLVDSVREERASVSRASPGG